MDKSPCISVLLPFHNAGAGILKAIESIRQQTFTDWELILVNNASTDISVDIAREQALGDPRIKVIDEPRKGIVHALNSGLLHCSAQLIARMDADDISLPQRLQLQYSFMQQSPETDLCATLVRHITSAEDTRGYSLYIDWINSIISHDDILLNMFIESPFAHPSVMFRKSSVEKYGNYRNGEFPEDYEMWLRWLSSGARMGKVPQVLLHWHDSPERLSRVDKRYHPDAFFSIKFQYLDKWLRKNNPFFPELVIWGAGKLARKRAAILQEAGHQVLFHIDIDPVKAKRPYCRLYTDITSAGNIFIVSLVGKHGARCKIRGHLNGHGFVEGKDFLLAAG